MNKGYIRFNPSNNTYYIGKLNPPQLFDNEYFNIEGVWEKLVSEKGRFTSIEKAVECCNSHNIVPVIDYQKIGNFKD